MPNLIVVDDSHIRKSAFAAAARQLKRLEQLESRLKSFHERDQKLFSDWFDLAFRDRRHKMDLLRGEYRELAEFYNWMNALVSMEDISLPEAAVRIREEQRLYREGTVKDRMRIDELRRVREEFIRAQLDRANSRERKRSQPEEKGETEETNYGRAEVTRALGRLADEEIEDWCADPEIAFLFLGDCIKAGHAGGDFKLFFRVWDLTHAKIQRQFAKEYQKEFGSSLFDVLEKMRDGGFAAEAPAANPLESLKLMYRQLVRKLHPDVNGEEAFAEDSWRRTMWQRVQVAYQGENLSLLNKLFHLTLLRGNELSDLRVGDLQTSQKWLADEISETEQSIKGLRSKPAWGFSRRKDLQPLARKLERQMEKDRAKLEEQVVDLRMHIVFMERMGRDQMRGRKNGGGGARKRKPSRRGSADQMSFFE
ncbi:MAG: J domain-containing protein [Bdellovibrionales bacterium]